MAGMCCGAVCGQVDARVAACTSERAWLSGAATQQRTHLPNRSLALLKSMRAKTTAAAGPPACVAAYVCATSLKSATTWPSFSLLELCSSLASVGGAQR